MSFIWHYMKDSKRERNECKKDGRIYNGTFFSRRLFIKFWEISMHFEWCTSRSIFSMGINFDGGGDEDMLFNFSLLGLSFYFGISCKILRKLAPRKYPYDRSIEASIHHNIFWWELWVPDDWDRERDRWRRGNFSLNPVKIIFGNNKVEYTVREERILPILFSEKTYQVKIQLKRRFDYPKRARWLGKYRYCYDAEVTGDDKCIPFPGKGENSWDCGEDGLYGQYGQGKTFGDAIGGIFDSVMKSRLRYGNGWNYVPEKMRRDDGSLCRDAVEGRG